MDDNIRIETTRLLLRRWRDDDADAESLHRYASDTRVSELALWPAHGSVEESRDVIRNYFMASPDLFAIVLKETGEPVGCVGLVPQGDEHFETGLAGREAGYWIGYPYWGRGLVTEALKGLIGYCMNDKRLQSLFITADSRNVASHRVAEKCGFKKIGDYVLDGVDSVAYRLSLTDQM